MARPSKLWFWKAADEVKVAASNSPKAIEVLDKFLAWTKANRAERTYDWYRDHIQSFIDSLSNQQLAADALKPFHVTEWVKPDWSATYQRGAMIAVQRAFRWAEKQGYISRSAISSLDKPAAERRDNCPTQKDYDSMLLHVKDDCFRRVLEFSWETGSRPQELVLMESQHVKGDRIEFPVKDSNGKKRNRIIFLNEKAKSIVNGIEGKLFLNSKGTAWTACSLDCRMKRIAKKTGRKFAMYDLRHAFATRMLLAGLDHTVVAQLMGHSNASMLCKVYSHLGQSSDYLLEKLKSVK